MSDKVILPGFPEAVSPVIETPDIAELLMYPNFQVAEADTVWKYGSDFQRKLLSLSPLKYNRKHVTVYSGVHIVSPHARAITPYAHDKSKSEWHIDGREDTYSQFDHWEPQETVFLFLANASKPTEFVKHEIEIVDPNLLAMDRGKFCHWMQQTEDAHGLIKDFAPIENSRLYEFTNHVHRAVMPKGVEFRYTFRIRETDRADIPTIQNQMPDHNRYWDVAAQGWRNTIWQQDEGIYIKYPKQWLGN